MKTAGLLLLGLVATASGRAETAAPTGREVGFSNGEVELKGTLVQPARQPAPAVVFLHGSGPMTRAGFAPYAEAFAQLGVASLAYDKRGTGASGGSWVTSSLDDLAVDALAAVEFLKSQDGIDSARIGFWAISQGGWIAPRAAARSDGVAFLIVVSGGGASPRESERFSYGQQFAAAGLAEADQAAGFALVDAYFDYLESGNGRAELSGRLNSLATEPDQPLHALAEQLGRILVSEANRPNWRWVASYDPATDLSSLKCPVLLLFGDRDRDQPTELAVKRWREGLARAGNDAVTLMVFPGAGHGIRVGGHHGRAPFADGYWEVQLGWLWRHVVDTQGSSSQ